MVLARLLEYRVRGRAGRRNEWLVGITEEEETERVGIATLIEGGFDYRLFEKSTAPESPRVMVRGHRARNPKTNEYGKITGHANREG
jgi:hypothetical protein